MKEQPELRGLLLAYHTALPHELGRYRGNADIVFVASRRWVYGYTA